MNIKTYPDLETLSAATAERFAEAAQQAIAARGRFCVALSGGHTPRRAFELLASEPGRSRVDWSRVHVFWGDERNVPPSDPDSNEGMARAALLDRVPIPAQNVHPMFNGGSNEVAAAAYDALMSSYFPPGGPTFDLVMMGMGPDGHTLSLFPGAGNLDAQGWAMPAATETAAVHDRISITARAAEASRLMLFEVAGNDKADALKKISQGDAGLPAGVVSSRAKGEVLWLIDQNLADAAGLPGYLATGS